MAAAAPLPDEIEITIFGPGFGESILIHFGNNSWAVVDSCLDNKTKRPAALEYLQSIGVNPSNAVKFILTTHWHNDHIGGMSELVAACTSAKFSFPLGLDKQQFAEFITLYNRKSTAIDNGVSEIYKTLNIVLNSQREWAFALGDQPLFMHLNEVSGVRTKVTALSPSHPEILNFIGYISSKSPAPGDPVSRVTAPKSNLLSAATWVEIGNKTILLGADLEERGRTNTGWSAVLASTTKPQGTASIFKIPHHGSANGHNDQVWTRMLTSDVTAVVTPWTRGSGLPTREDCLRVDQLASQSFITSSRVSLALRHGQAVTKTIREAKIKLTRSDYPTGFVRLTTPISTIGRGWRIQCSPEARELASFF